LADLAALSSGLQKTDNKVSRFDCETCRLSRAGCLASLAGTASLHTLISRAEEARIKPNNLGPRLRQNAAAMAGIHWKQHERQDNSGSR
jgi:hypothetical protein